MGFCENLKRLRENAKLSQKDLAERIGMTAQSYNNYEKRGYNPTPEMLVKLAKALNTDLNTLVGFKPNNIDVQKVFEMQIQIVDTLIESLSDIRDVLKNANQTE